MIAVPLRRGMVALTLAVLALSLTAATQIQVSYWKDGVTLFKHSLAVTGDCVTTVVNLAAAYSRAGRYPEMLSFVDAKLAVANRPENRAKLTGHRAVALCAMRRYDEAMASAQRSIDMGNTDDSNYWVLAFSNFELGRYDQAAKYLPKARGGRSKPPESSWVEGVRDHNWASLEKTLTEKSLPPGDLPAASTGAQTNSCRRH